MTAAAITLMPGRTTLADWRAVAQGARVRLDPAAMPAVDAARSAGDSALFCSRRRRFASVPIGRPCARPR